MISLNLKIVKSEIFSSILLEMRPRYGYTEDNDHTARFEAIPYNVLVA